MAVRRVGLSPLALTLVVAACVHQRPTRESEVVSLEARTPARADDDDSTVARGVRCANLLLDEAARRKFLRPYAAQTYRTSRAADAAFPLRVGTGYVVHQLRRDWSPINDERVGGWIALPINAEFAMDTYVTAYELSTLYPRLAAATRSERAEILMREWALSRRFAESLGDDLHFALPRDARALQRFVAVRYLNRGRRFHCFDEDGRDLWPVPSGATSD